MTRASSVGVRSQRDVREKRKKLASPQVAREV
jgi:hypothetical protein